MNNQETFVCGIMIAVGTLLGVLFHGEGYTYFVVGNVAMVVMLFVLAVISAKLDLEAVAIAAVHASLLVMIPLELGALFGGVIDAAHHLIFG